MKKEIKTSWNNVSESYDKYLSSDKSYHSEIIIPNLKRIIGNIKDKKVLDIACGQGQISNMFFEQGAEVSGFDVAEDLIKIAKQNNKNISYKVLNAEDFASDYKDQDSYQKFDIVTCVLAIQNIENVKKVLENIKNITHKDSKIIFVINHPSFRIPKSSSWGYSQEGEKENNKSIQYRRIDKYMSEDKIKIDMSMGEKAESKKKFVYSYHRPLQYFFKLFNNNNLVVYRLEEWISDRVSEGKNSERENVARKEFPLFMCICLEFLSDK